MERATECLMGLQISEGLPEDLIVQILVRLPIKSLIRFTSVSKRWRFIILSDPKFGKSQFQLASEQQTLSCRGLYEANESDCESLDFDKSEVRKIRCPFKQPGGRLRILSSCNGLVFAAPTNSDMYLWNPSTSLFRKLPDPGVHPSDIGSFYGFGYLSSTDEYKVVVGWRPVTGVGNAQVLSSRANSWRTIKLLYNPSPSAGYLFKEAIHWWFLFANDIAVFDLTKEEFRAMLLPTPVTIQSLISVGSVGGCLCVFNQKDDFMDLWVMREYAVAESWTKLYNLKVSDQHEWVFYLRVVLTTETSIFLQKGSECDWGDNKYELIRICHNEGKIDDKRELFDVFAYEESLLWLNH